MNQRTEKQTTENLDVEFKKILCIIRERIPYINSNAYLMQCRVWLEKLSGPNVNKALRNLYLLELCGQIQKNKLLPPFNEAPPPGSLKSLTKVLMNRQSFRFLFQDLQRKKSKLSNLNKNSKPDVKEQYEAIDCVDNKILCPHNTQTWDSLELDKEERIPSEPIQNINHKPQEQNTSVKLHCQDVGQLQNKSFDCGEPAMDVQYDTSSCLINQETDTKKDDESWSDLTDGSSDVESISQKKGNKLRATIMKTKEKNWGSDKAIQNKTESGKLKLEPFNDDFESEHAIIKYYDGEESNLKVPKDTNYISEDWKNTIDALQLRLSEMAQQNNELKAFIQKLESQMDDIQNKNKEDTDQTIKMLESLRSEEISRQKKIHADRILQLDKSYHSNLNKLENGYQEKTRTLIASFEQKISDINKQKDDITRKKDDEICRLTEGIQQQCTRITNDISTLQNQVSSCCCDKKLHLLKKCVSKMDKLFQRSEKEYLKQIDRLRQELDIKDTALQIQLKMQKAELITETSSERQEEFEKILNSVEVKYIKMLELHETQIMEMKKHDDQKIQFLKELISQHGIAYDERDV